MALDVTDMDVELMANFPPAPQAVGGVSTLHNDREALEGVRWNSLLQRAKDTAAYLGDVGIEASRQKMRSAVERLTRDAKGNTIPPHEFQQRLNMMNSIVFTGHPTFGKPPELAAAFAQYFSHLADPISAQDSEKTIELQLALKSASVLAFQPPNLTQERDQAHAAIENAHTGFRELEKVAIEVAQAAYPDEWQFIDYMPGKIYIWNTFDFDGRTDIRSEDLMRDRILLQTRMLESQILPDFKTLGQRFPDNEGVRLAVEKIERTLELLRPHYEYYCQYDPKKLDEMGMRFMQEAQERITHPGELIRPIEDLLADASVTDDAVKAELVLIRSRLKNHGISYAHPHFRVNASNILQKLHDHHSSISSENTLALDDRALATLGDMIEGVRAQQTHLGSLFQTEPADPVSRQLIFMRQVRDFLDSHSPTRYLIAETHNASVVLGALYFAKFYGVDGHVDISPLFEDAEGVDYAPEIMGKLLATDEFRTYLEQDRSSQYRHMPWLFTQHGFSDLGRFEGQLGAKPYQEKAIGGMLKILKERHLPYGLSVQYSHGMGMGRAAHPASYQAQLDALSTPALHSYAAHNGLKLSSEDNFQGQDGYMFWSTPENSIALIAAGADHHCLDAAQTPETKIDPLYTRGSNGLQAQSKAFFRECRYEHEKLSTDSNYVLLIDLFKNLLPQTGSRPVKRDSSAGGARALPRAIPNNAVLQQLGLLATVTYGVGRAIEKDPQRFNRLVEESPVFRSHIDALYRVMDLCDPEIMRAMIQVYNPDLWRERSRKTNVAEEKTLYAAIAEKVDEYGYYPRLSAICERVTNDFERISEQRQALNHVADPAHDPSYIQETQAKRLNLRRVTQARMSTAFAMFEAAQAIPYLPANGINRETLIHDLMHFNTKKAIEALKKLSTPAAPIEFPLMDSFRQAGDIGHDTSTSLQEILKILEAVNDNNDLAFDAASNPWCAIG